MTWPARRAAWAFEERVVWAGADAARAVLGDVVWPFERVAWSVRRYAIWPVQDWFGAWGLVARSVFVLSLLWIGAVACLTGVRIANHDGSAAPTQPIASGGGHPVAVKLADTPAVKQGPVLRGAVPTFAPRERETAGDGAAAAPSAAATDASAISSVDATESSGETPRAALRVAWRFANAFVLYEVGQRRTEALQVFRETATAPLVKSLAERPPRQPAGFKVPRAKVLNVVPGPRHGDSLDVSVALLRVGDTTELRLHLERADSGWLITDVRG